jgi:hypothetical protein
MGRISDSPLKQLTDISIIRVVRGPGGDIASRTTQASGLSGFYEPVESQLRTNAESVTVAITGRFFIDPVDSDLDALDVVNGDFVTHTDWRGAATPEREVVSVNPFWKGTVLHHLELDVGG